MVKPSGEKARAAEREERPSAIHGWTALVGRLAEPATRASGTPAWAYVDGALWALDSASGKVLWRRYVGTGPPAMQVQPLAGEGKESDWLAVDSRYPDLLCLRAASGKLKWRQPLAAPLVAAPAVTPTAAYAGTSAATLERIELTSGQRTHQVALPSPPVGSPVASADGKFVYQLGARGELFALDAGDLTCKAVLYVGAERGGLAYSPVLAGQYVAIVDHAGLDESSLRVVALDAKGLPADVAAVVPLPRRIAAQPVVVSNHLIVVDESGSVTALAISGNRDAPLKTAGQVPGGSTTGEWFIVAAEGQFWVAGAGCRAFEIKKGRLAARGKRGLDAVFDAPPMPVGDGIVAACRPAGAGSAVALALSAAAARTWEVALGDVANELADDGSTDWPGSLRLASVSNGGAEKPLDWKQPAAWKTLQSFARGVRLSPQRWLWLGAGAGPQQPCSGMPRAELPARSCRRASWPRRWRWAADCSCRWPTEALALVDPASGKSLAAALRPNVHPGQLVGWTAPALVPGGNEAVVADDHPTLYLVALRKEPQPQLVKVAGAALDAPVVAGPVVAGSNVFVVTRDGMLPRLRAQRTQAGRRAQAAQPPGQLDRRRGRHGPGRQRRRIGRLRGRQEDNLLDSLRRHDPLRHAPGRRQGHPRGHALGPRAAHRSGRGQAGREGRARRAARRRACHWTDRRRRRPMHGFDGRRLPVGHRDTLKMKRHTQSPFTHRGAALAAGLLCALALAGRAGADDPPGAEQPAGGKAAAEKPAAEKPAAPEPQSLLYVDPFDEVTLDADNNNAVLKVFPIELPNRRLPKAPQPTDTIEVRLKEHPDQTFEIAWKSIKRVKLFEQMLLDAAADLAAGGRYDEAYEYYELLEQKYPQTAGVKQAIDEYLWTDALDAVTRGHFEQALALLVELDRRGSKHEGLADLYAKTTSRLVEQAIKQKNYRAVRGWLKNLAERYPDDSAATVKKYETQLSERAAALKAKAESQWKAKQVAPAWRRPPRCSTSGPAFPAASSWPRKFRPSIPRSWSACPASPAWRKHCGGQWCAGMAQRVAANRKPAGSAATTDRPQRAGARRLGRAARAAAAAAAAGRGPGARSDRRQLILRRWPRSSAGRSWHSACAA